MRRSGIVFALFLAAGPAFGGVEIDQVNACFDAAVTGKSNPAQCIDAAQNACLDNARDTPAVATLCYSDARNAWSAALSAALEKMTAHADEKLAAVARIETKYNLLANLMECDRIEELSVAVSDLTGNDIALQSTRCQATASAATYMHLYLRAGSLPKGDNP
jgi:hypothetical protein